MLPAPVSKIIINSRPVWETVSPRCIERIRALFDDSGSPTPDAGRLSLLCSLALQAQYCLYSAAIDDPSAELLDEFFDVFIRAAIHTNGEPS